MTEPSVRELAQQVTALNAAVHVLLAALTPEQQIRAAAQLEPLLQYARAKLEASRASDAEVSRLAELHESLLKALQYRPPSR